MPYNISILMSPLQVKKVAHQIHEFNRGHTRANNPDYTSST